MRIYSRILGTGSYLPEKRLTNADLAAELAQQGVETSDDWIVERTGIRARHFAADQQGSSDLATEAARQALSAAGISADDLDLIIVATSVGFGMIPIAAPHFYAHFPAWVATIFHSGISSAALVAIVLNLLLHSKNMILK